MKKRIMGISLIMGLILLGFIGTYALFNDKVRTKGVITTGAIKIAIIQTNKEGEPVQPLLDPIVPGDEVSHIVQVENIGNKKAWTRVKLNKIVTELDGSPTNLTESDLALISLDMQNEWTLGSDGYWYYEEILLPDQRTKEMFYRVKLDEQADNRFASKRVHVEIQAEGVQSDNNGTSVAEAIGWP